MSKKFLCALFSLCFLVFTVLEAVDVFCFDANFYRKEYAALKVAEDIQIDFEDLMEGTQVLLDYTAGKRENMVYEAVINGQNRELFNDREKAHMIDVSALYLNSMKVKRICLFLSVAAVIILLIRKDSFLFTLAQQFNLISLIFLLVIGALALYAYSDFNAFWIRFHHVFFTKNDFWLLNPRTDMLIRMVPEQFFYDLVFRIVAGFFTVFFLSNAAALIYRKKALKHA